MGRLGPTGGHSLGPSAGLFGARGSARSSGTWSRTGPWTASAGCCCTWAGSWGPCTGGPRTGDRPPGRTRPGWSGNGGRTGSRTGPVDVSQVIELILAFNYHGWW